MKHILIITFFTLFYNVELKAQDIVDNDTDSKHAIYYNYNTYALYGHFHTLNYEYGFHHKLKARGGISHIRIQGDIPWSVDTHLGLLYGISYIMGKNNFHFVISTGINSAYLYKSRIKVRTIPFAELGIRYEPKNDGLILRAHLGIFNIGAGCGYKF